MKKKIFDVIIIGAGAAGLMAASTAGKNGKKVLLLEHNEHIAQKIRISGGGKCNFTNLGASPKNYISQNPSFVISALSQYTQQDFIKMVKDHKIGFHEKTLGQLFCDGSSNQIINMFVLECKQNKVDIITGIQVTKVNYTTEYTIHTSKEEYSAHSLIVATGGLSIPKLGATDLGYRIARQFGHKIIQTNPGLVPLQAPIAKLDFFKSLSGVSIASKVKYKEIHFAENILFTHRGLSGPAILQISSYLNPERFKKFIVDMVPNENLHNTFIAEKNSKVLLGNFLKMRLPNRFVEIWGATLPLNYKLTDLKLATLKEIADQLHFFVIEADGTEGYAKAEVTIGGVDTKELCSKTMMSKKVSNLYFIGEVVDVSGWLGGYNFQWAWSSGYVAGNSII